MRFSILHPSRQRPEKSFQTISNWVNRAGISGLEIIISLDRDDPQLNAYYSRYSQNNQLTIIEHANTCAVEAVNVAASIATGDVFIVVSDDFDCPQNWAVTLEKALKGKRDFVLKTYDGVQNYIVTLPILDSVYYQRFGDIYPECYSHMFADTEFTHVADCTRRLIIRNDITFQHNHYSIKQGTKVRDEVTIKADLTYDSGCKIYLDRVRKKFGLDPKTDIMKLSPEARGHVEWLRKYGL